MTGKGMAFGCHPDENRDPERIKEKPLSEASTCKDLLQVQMNGGCEATIWKFWIVRQEEKLQITREKEHYNLDAIISVKHIPYNGLYIPTNGLLYSL